MYRINKSINSPSLVDHVILVHAQFHNRLKLCDYKGNLKVECAILPLLNANVFKFPKDLVFTFISTLNALCKEKYYKFKAPNFYYSA